MNETGVINELRGASAFFPNPEAAPATATQEEPQDTMPLPQATTPEGPVRGVRPVRRKKIRHPFDLYEDQVERLRDLSADDRKAGGDGSMSRMVREALDLYLAQLADGKD